MQEISYFDRNGEFRKETEVFNVPVDPKQAESVLNARYAEAKAKVFAAGGTLDSAASGAMTRVLAAAGGSSRSAVKTSSIVH